MTRGYDKGKRSARTDVSTVETAQAGRMPPHNIESERLVLGAVLFDNASLDKVLDFLTPADFYRSANGRIYEAMLELNRMQEGIDAVTLPHILDSKGALNDVGGREYIIDLLGDTSTAANIVYHARIVARLATLRRLISAASEISAEAYDIPVDVEAFMDDVEAKIFELSRSKATTPYLMLKDVMREGINHLAMLYEKGGSISGLSSGFRDLDEITGGFRPGQLIIVGARPGMGKTSFALNAAMNAVRHSSASVLFFSLEMSKQDVGMRILSSESGVPSNRIRTPSELLDADWDYIIDASKRFSESKFFIDDTAGLQISELRSKARRFKAEHGLDLLVIDYLQLMRGGNQRYENRNQEITDISRSLKALAKELEVPIMALSQLSRDADRRKGEHRPVLADLRESGSIEQDADMVAFLFREAYYTKQGESAEESDSRNASENPARDSVTELILAKHRNGPTATIKLMFVESITRFENYTAMEAPPYVPN